MKRMFSGVLLICLFVSFQSVTLAEDWLAWRGNNHNGVSTETAFNIESLKWTGGDIPHLWKANVGKSYSAVAVKGDRVYTMGNSDNKEDVVYCLDARTGSILWRYSYSHAPRRQSADPNPTATTATPVLDGDRLYVVSREGVATCLNALSGVLVWTRDLHKEGKYKEAALGYAGSALVKGDKVYFNIGNNGIALNKETGAVIWKSTEGQAGHSTPVPFKVGTQSAIAFANGSGVAATDANTGKLLWQHKWKTEYDINAIDPIMLEDGFFMTAFGRSQRVQVKGNITTVLYESRQMQTTFVSPVKIGNYLYGNGKGRLVCMDIADGKSQWDMTGLGSGALIANGKRLIVLKENGEVLIVNANPTKCDIVARGKVMEGNCWMQPVLANGRLYCRNVDGDLVCVDMSQ